MELVGIAHANNSLEGAFRKVIRNDRRRSGNMAQGRNLLRKGELPLPFQIRTMMYMSGLYSSAVTSSQYSEQGE